MANRIAVCLLLVLTFPGFSAEIPDYWRDIHGRPFVLGKAIDDRQIGIRVPSSRLRCGQPICVWCVWTGIADNAPYLRPELHGPKRNITFHLTNDRGERIDYKLQTDYTSDVVLEPTGKHAQGRYLVPGRYRLVAIHEFKWDPRDPVAWVGKLESNTVEFEVVGTASKNSDLLPKAIRAKARKAVADLNDATFKVRAEARKELATFGLDALPIIDEALNSNAAEVREAALGLFRQLLPPIWEREIPLFEKDEFPYLVSTLSESAWKTFAREFGDDFAKHVRVEAARFAPVRMETDPLSESQIRELLRDLNHDEAHVRLLAMRRMPRTTNADLLNALFNRLEDSYKARRSSCLEAVDDRFLADEATRWALPWQGKPVIPLLIERYRKTDGEELRRRILDSLSRIGPDPRTTAFLRQCRKDKPDESGLFIKHLCDQGGEAIAEMLEIASNEKASPRDRGLAIESLAQCADRKLIGNAVVKALESRDDYLVSIAAEAAMKIGLDAALPALATIANDSTRDQNLRNDALRAYARLAAQNDAMKLLSQLLNSTSVIVRGHAASELGALENRAAVEPLLKMLDDRDSYVRYHADLGLRSIARLATGVGYDSEKPNPQLWRDYWKSKK